jgi:outer membrane protein
MRGSVFGFFVYVIGMGVANGAQSIRITDLPKLITERNLSVESKRQELASKKAKDGSLTRSFLPQIDAFAGQENYKVGSGDEQSDPYWKVEGTLNLFRGFRDRAEARARQAMARAAESELRSTEREKLMQARILFWSIIAYQKAIDLVDQAIKQNDTNLRQARRRQSAGVSTSADALEFEMNRTVLNQEQKTLILDLDATKNKLAVLIDSDDHVGMKIEGEFAHPPEGEFQTENLDEKFEPSLTALQAKKEAFSFEANKTANWWLPSLDLYSSYEQFTERERERPSASDRLEFAMGVRLRLNIADGLELRRESQAKTALAHSLTAQEQERVGELRAKFHELKHDLKLHHELIHDADESVNQATKFLTLTIQEYNRAIKNGPDVLEASNKKLSFSRRAVELARDYQITKAEILAILGR